MYKQHFSVAVFLLATHACIIPMQPMNNAPTQEPLTILRCLKQLNKAHMQQTKKRIIIVPQQTDSNPAHQPPIIIKKINGKQK